MWTLVKQQQISGHGQESCHLSTFINKEPEANTEAGVEATARIQQDLSLTLTLTLTQSLTWLQQRCCGADSLQQEGFHTSTQQKLFVPL